MLEALIGICIGLAIGFLLGFLCTKKMYDEASYDYGFTTGYDVAKGNFYNPQAKG